MAAKKRKKKAGGKATKAGGKATKAGGKATKAGGAARRKMGEKTKKILDPNMGKALAHPLRVHILATVNRRCLSPIEVAEECEESIPKVSYHFDVLEKCDCIELVAEVPRRGAVEHVYRGTRRALLGDADWKQLPLSIRGGATGATLRDLFENAGEAVSAGTFDARDDSHLSWTAIVLDEQAWREMNPIMEDTRGRIMDVAAEAAKRLGEAGEEGINVSFALASYETPKVKRRKS
ncbi:MAG: helix-turn-helix transcriptional regulator [Solirubrobacterales bacterium]|nr:helix-turn-helix transcriptional regulator [Solirubrobacterales bacterium]